jgi:hypothetical protein
VRKSEKERKKEGIRHAYTEKDTRRQTDRQTDRQTEMFLRSKLVKKSGWFFLWEDSPLLF